MLIDEHEVSELTCVEEIVLPRHAATVEAGGVRELAVHVRNKRQLEPRDLIHEARNDDVMPVRH
jgi:hypothetical protein